jgi:hypothetical protein
MTETGSLRWRKSSYSPNTNCVELAELPDGTIAIRNSNHPDAGTLTFPRPAIAAWITAAKSGHLDDLV